MRNQSVTIAKGLAIILMVMGHARCPEYINNILSLMRMPLFFIMSGYCFKEKYLDQPKDFFNKRMKGIYWPYIKSNKSEYNEKSKKITNRFYI